LMLLGRDRLPFFKLDNSCSLAVGFPYFRHSALDAESSLFFTGFLPSQE